LVGSAVVMILRHAPDHPPKILQQQPENGLAACTGASGHCPQGVRRQHHQNTMQDNSTIVRGFIEKAINEGDIDSAGQFVWEDVVEQVPFPGQGPGLKGLKDVLRSMRSGFR